jgi:hypothetical protein
LEADTLTQGVNRILSATIELTFKDGYVKRSNFGIRPDGKFVPVQKLDEKTGKLEGFRWRIEDRPARKDIDQWRTIVEIDPGLKNLFDDPDVKLEMPTEEQIEKALILGKRPGKPILDQ